VIVSMPSVQELPGHDEPTRISLARSSPLSIEREVAPPRRAPPPDPEPQRDAQPDPKALAWLTSCTPDEFLAWQEAAAIAEYDGGLPRRQAEIIALHGLFGRSQQARGPQTAATPPPLVC